MTYAGFWKRFAAAIIDGLITSVVGFVVGIILGVTMVAGGTTDDPELLSATGNILGILLGWTYFAVMESSPTQGTLGKMALGIQVIYLSGGRIGLGRATGRHFSKIVSALLLLIGFLMAAFIEK